MVAAKREYLASGGQHSRGVVRIISADANDFAAIGLDRGRARCGHSGGGRERMGCIVVLRTAPGC